ncbi:MAG: hypothetical protein IT159_04955 [Bryobacterales bacterium]|nr:hypothetical protein [Bryobacterales bacterium]
MTLRHGNTAGNGRRAISAFSVMWAVLMLLQLCTPSGAAAAVTAYSSRSAFEAASTNLQKITFEGVVPEGQTGTMLLGPLALNGVTFTANLYSLWVLNSNIYNTGASLAVRRVQGNPPGVVLKVSLPPGTSAVGADFFVQSSLRATITLSTGDVLTFSGLPFPNLVFFGITSTVPISSLSIEAADGVDLDDFTFGQTKGISLASLSLSSSSVVGGASVTGTIALSGPAPAGGVLVALQCNNSAALTPPTVTVPAGQTSTNFTITTSPVPSAQSLTLTATYAGASRTADLTVNPPPQPLLAGISLRLPAIIAEHSVEAVVTLTGPAPSRGSRIDLRSDNAVAQVPASVTVPAGATSATFAIQALTVTTSATATISASLSGVLKTATLVVNPPHWSPADDPSFTQLAPDVRTHGPLAGRTPLILIHGHNGELSDWDSFLAYFTSEDQDPVRASRFRTKYKVYQFHYISDQFSLSQLARALRNQIDDLTMATPELDKPLVILAHSMGGLLARWYMIERHSVGRFNNRPGGERVDTLITLATPHHGSPGANHQSRDQLALNADQRDQDYETPSIWGDLNNWTTVVKAASVILWQQHWKHISYQMPNRSDLLWDNFDSVMNQGNDDINDLLRHLNENAAYDKNIVAYYGYLDPTRADYEELVNRVYTPLPLFGPHWLAARALVALDDKHEQLLCSSVIMNYGLYKDDRFYARNDGMVPVQSAAFDGHTVGRHVECPNYDHLQMLEGSEERCANGLTLFGSLEADLLQEQPVPGEISADGVVNAASFVSGAVAPGEIVAVFGSSIGPPELAGLEVTPSGFVSNAVAGTRVLFDGVAAPILYAWSQQTSAVVPYSVMGKGTVEIAVEYRGTLSNVVRLPVAESAPGLFAADATGKGQGAILNQDYSRNSAANPAEPGSIVMIYGTGEGQTEPQGIDGKVTTEPLPRPRLPVSVKIGGVDAEVLYAGGVPTVVAGLLQINARVPTAAPVGNAVPVLVTIGNSTSQSGITMAVAGSSDVTLSSLSVSPAAVRGGASSTGTVTLSAPAPTGGAAVSLQTNNQAASVPASAAIPAGQMSATFSISTTSVASTQNVTISAAYRGTSRTATLTINPVTVTLSSLTVSPSTVTAGVSSTGTVTLSAQAPTGGAVVSLQTNNQAASLPASATIPAGQMSATFSISTTSVATTQYVTISATYGGTSRTATLTINPVAVTLSSLSVSPSAVTAGASSTGTVTLSAPAPAGGTVVSLQTNNQAASVPASATIPAGQMSATFSISTTSVASTQNVTISATYGGTSKTATLTINPVPVSPYADKQIIQIQATFTVQGRNIPVAIELTAALALGQFIANVVAMQPPEPFGIIFLDGAQFTADTITFKVVYPQSQYIAESIRSANMTLTFGASGAVSGTLKFSTQNQTLDGAISGVVTFAF